MKVLKTIRLDLQLGYWIYNGYHFFCSSGVDQYFDVPDHVRRLEAVFTENRHGDGLKLTMRSCRNPLCYTPDMYVEKANYGTSAYSRTERLLERWFGLDKPFYLHLYYYE